MRRPGNVRMPSQERVKDLLFSLGHFDANICADGMDPCIPATETAQCPSTDLFWRPGTEPAVQAHGPDCSCGADDTTGTWILAKSSLLGLPNVPATSSGGGWRSAWARYGSELATKAVDPDLRRREGVCGACSRPHDLLWQLQTMRLSIPAAMQFRKQQGRLELV